MKPNGNSLVLDEGLSPIGWAPILGHWSVSEDQIAYKGGDERFASHGQEFPMGILVNNRELLSGACNVDVEFEDLSSGHSAGAAEKLPVVDQDASQRRLQCGCGVRRPFVRSLCGRHYLGLPVPRAVLFASSAWRRSSCLLR